MILHGTQRAGANALARHLLNDDDNDHVDVHEIRGFVADSVPGAFQEINALSRGTRCKQFMFSLSLNPPPNENVSTEAFEQAVNEVEDHLKLSGQPRVIVFHEKKGRRHAHCVWSRIDTETMTAKPLPFHKNRLREVSKDLYLDHGWQLPPGLVDGDNRNPLNFTLDQWQQAKRTGNDPKETKRQLRECWAISDSKNAFEAALDQRGYYLARGDRRGFVAVDWRGEVYSLSRWTGVKAKLLKERLGQPSGLPAVDETREKLKRALASTTESHITELERRHKKKMRALDILRKQQRDKHRAERNDLSKKQEARWKLEAKDRQEKIRSGFKGVWDKISGRRAKAIKANELSAYDALERDREQCDRLIIAQLQEARPLQDRISKLREIRQQDIQAIEGFAEAPRYSRRLGKHSESPKMRL